MGPCQRPCATPDRWPQLPSLCPAVPSLHHRRPPDGSGTLCPYWSHGGCLRSPPHLICALAPLLGEYTPWSLQAQAFFVVCFIYRTKKPWAACRLDSPHPCGPSELKAASRNWEAVRNGIRASSAAGSSWEPRHCAGVGLCFWQIATCWYRSDEIG